MIEDNLSTWLKYALAHIFQIHIRANFWCTLWDIWIVEILCLLSMASRMTTNTVFFPYLRSAMGQFPYIHSSQNPFSAMYSIPHLNWQLPPSTIQSHHSPGLNDTVKSSISHHVAHRQAGGVHMEAGLISDIGNLANISIRGLIILDILKLGQHGKINYWKMLSLGNLTNIMDGKR